MKKEKGFTLIELLAVIIILGILMMVAIPSVTTYINSSRKSGYLDNAKQFITAAITAVNSADKIEFYDEHTMLLIPVGTDEDLSFIKLEKGGQSPYSNTYFFAYVGVTYDNSAESYTYYFTSVDGAGQGIAMTSQKDLEKKDADKLITTGLKTDSNLAYSTKLHEIYDNSGKTNTSGDSNATIPPLKFKTSKATTNYAGTSTGALTGTAELVANVKKTGESESNIKYILICSATECPVLDAS